MLSLIIAIKIIDRSEHLWRSKRFRYWNIPNRITCFVSINNQIYFSSRTNRPQVRNTISIERKESKQYVLVLRYNRKKIAVIFLTFPDELLCRIYDHKSNSTLLCPMCNVCRCFAIIVDSYYQHRVCLRFDLYFKSFADVPMIYSHSIQWVLDVKAFEMLE